FGSSHFLVLLHPTSRHNQYLHSFPTRRSSDLGSTTFRHEFFDDYKGGRDSMPGELSEQMPYLKELLTAFGLKSYELPNFEADDIIGTLANEAARQDYEVVVLSGDKDLTQLVTKDIRVDITVKGVSN